MAIGFNLPGIPGQIRGTAEEAGAVPDLGQAMMQGFRSNIENVQGYPRQLAQQLLSNQLANKIRGVEAKYAEPMAKTKYDQALAALQHQGMVNKYYPQLMESQLSTAGLSQSHQRMMNERAQMDLNIYKDAYNAFKNQGATHEQAHQAAINTVQQQGALREPVVPEFTQMLTGKAMPEYLSNLVEEQPQTRMPQQEPMINATEGYSPIQENLFAPQYSQTPMAMELAPQLETAEAPDYLRRPMGMELSEGLSARMPVTKAPQAQPAQAQPAQAQSYVEQLQQQGYNTDKFNPQNAGADELYLKSPLHRAIIEKMAPGTGIKRYNDFPRNRQIVTTTLPSGATKTTIESLGGAQGVNGISYKAQSKEGRILEDLRHYREIGDKEAEENTKKALSNAVKEKELPLDQLLNKRDEYQAAGNYSRAQDYQDLIDAKKRGATTTINLGKNEYYKTDPKTGEKLGYYRPQTNEEQKITRARIGFTYAFPNIIKGTEAYSGDALKGTAKLIEDINNYKVDPAARKRLINLGVGQKFKVIGTLGEMQASGSPKVKIALQGFDKTVDPRSPIGARLQEFLLKSYGTDPELNKEIDSIFDQKFKELSNLQEQASIKPYYIPFETSQDTEKKTLAANINSGVKKIKSSKVIKITPDMVKGL
ncbi:MAG: hypothetical protein FGM16_09280 [Flavobacterium sp.]|nr:hypothetical protein [Flavobacterium sp.]